ncbi:MAG: cobalt transporter CbiM [Treponema sp.]|nr:cobalt transporter CbiM [Treponema sp.]
MHIPENYLSPATCAVLTAAMVPVWVHAVRNVKKELPKEKIAMIGVGAAFSFIGMMFNVPLPGGTTGHAVGGTLIAAVLGPNAACLAVSVALLIQALLFGDGGILSFGANCINMAFAMPFIGYFLYQLITKALSKGNEPKLTHRLIGAGIGSYAGINLAAFMAAIEFGIQPYLFHNEAGQALYCPYGLNIAIPSMMIGHLTIFGLAEVIFTVAILAFIVKMVPSLFTTNTEVKADKKELLPVGILLAVLVAVVPLGLLAEGTAWGEWGAEEIAAVESNGVALGYTPSGLENGWSLEALIPDYSMNGVPEVMAYILSAIIGIAILVILFRLLSSLKKTPKQN